MLSRREELFTRDCAALAMPLLRSGSAISARDVVIADSGHFFSLFIACLSYRYHPPHHLLSGGSV
jgi:hypothetical protein